MPRALLSQVPTLQEFHPAVRARTATTPQYMPKTCAPLLPPPPCFIVHLLLTAIINPHAPMRHPSLPTTTQFYPIPGSSSSSRTSEWRGPRWKSSS